MKLLMITGDKALAEGKKGAFYYTLEEFSKYWERIDIICPRASRVSNFEPLNNIFKNVFIHSSPRNKFFQPRFILKMGAEIYKEEKFDLFTVHSYPPFYNDLGGIWLYKKIKKPYILEIHHITGYPKSADFKEKFYRFLTAKFIGFFAKSAKLVRVVNQKQVPEFLFKAGIDKDKIRYISSAYIDLEVFKPLESEKKYDVVFVGRLTKNKGIGLLLEAVKIIKAKISNFKLIIVGDGPLKNKIKDFIQKNKLQNNVELTGWLSDSSEIAEIYNRSKIFVMPSFNEGGPRACLEAMACKVAVITTRVGTMLDVVQDGENGVFIDWKIIDIAEKTINLLENNDLREKIAENGFKTVQQFERKKMIKNYAETYQNLLLTTRI